MRRGIYRIWNEKSQKFLKLYGSEWLDYETAQLFLADMMQMGGKGLLIIGEL